MNHFRSHRPVVMGTHWMITADHPLAARAGAGVLEAGGNAVDAAVAANLVMTVVRPHMCGPGGDLFALVHMADGRFDSLNASGRAPQRATLESFADKGLSAFPETGPLTPTVPGAVKGWADILVKYGTMGLDSLMADAIDYAENGFPMYPELAAVLEDRKKPLSQSEAAMNVFFPGGGIPEAGTRLVQADFGKTLRLIAENGPDALYRGSLGEALVSFMKKADGLIEESDLAGHTSSWDEPITTGYKGLQVTTTPPNTQGIALLMQAGILEKIGLDGLACNGPDLIHTMVEAKKLAFADRDRYVCDPSFHAVPVDDMLSPDTAARLASKIDKSRAAHMVTPSRYTQGGTDTVFLAVVDSDGNAVSMIQSLFEFFGSCVMVPGTGMLLHNRGRGFSLDPEHPNRLEPGKRPYHTLHPAMVLQGDRPHYLLGSPGADGQTQTVMQLLVSMLEYGADEQQAAEAPRWRSNPDGSLWMESRFADETIGELKNRGHNVVVRPEWDSVMGSAQIIRIDKDQGVLHAGADPRRRAYAIGR